MSQLQLNCPGRGCPLKDDCQNYRDPSLPAEQDVHQEWVTPPYDPAAGACSSFVAVPSTLVLIDNPVNGWSHLVAGSIPQLHAFAESIGVKRCWFENKRYAHQPHYDLKGDQIKKAVAAGAVMVSRRDLLLFLQKHYHPGLPVPAEPLE